MKETVLKTNEGTDLTRSLNLGFIELLLLHCCAILGKILGLWAGEVHVREVHPAIEE